jgi:WD40 repeat protein
LDNNVHIWGLNSPYIPKYSISGHSDAVTQFICLKNDKIITCSKDSTIKFHDLKDAERPKKVKIFS